jgi:hypothetical protein
MSNVSIGTMSVTLSSTRSALPVEDDVISLQPPPLCQLRQKSVSVTLTGTSLFCISAALLVSIHYLGTGLTECLILLAPLLVLVHNDYENFLGLGPGGTPSTFYGYLQISWWRLWALRNPFVPPANLRVSHASQSGILRSQDLPYRSGPRPRVAGIAPQRQLDQHGSRHCYQALRRAMVKLEGHSPLKFGTERSCVEKHGLALFAKHALRTNCQGEIVHVHDSDHSMHMCLHPDDIGEALAKGWGQMHPLARKGWFLQMPVAANFVMVYAPRSKSCLLFHCPSLVGEGEGEGVGVIVGVGEIDMVAFLTVQKMSTSCKSSIASSRQPSGILSRKTLRSPSCYRWRTMLKHHSIVNSRGICVIPPSTINTNLSCISLFPSSNPSRRLDCCPWRIS